MDRKNNEKKFGDNRGNNPGQTKEELAETARPNNEGDGKHSKTIVIGTP